MTFSASHRQILDNIEVCFPQLKKLGYRVTSPCTVKYNCIAWAAGDSAKWWWPVTHYWPGNAPAHTTIAAFSMAFAELGYEACATGKLEDDFEKIALYVDNQWNVTHAARQLDDVFWTSKLGKMFDITHTLAGLEGPKPSYGYVRGFLKRRRI